MDLKIPDFFLHWKKFWGLFFVWLLTSTIGCLLRLYPLTHYSSSESYDKASLLVISNLKKTVAATIDRDFPNLPPLEKKKLIKEQFDTIIKNEKDKVRATIAALSQNLDRQSPPGRTAPYLLASDSYYYYGLTENIITTGSISPTIRGSKFFHPLMLAPSGYWEPLNLHPYVGALAHRLISLFNPRADLMFSVSFVPLLLLALALIPFLYLCQTLKYPLSVTLAGAVNLALAGIFLKRSMFAWYDDDPYNVIFPLLILAFVFHGIDIHKNKRKTFLCAILTGLIVSTYALFWHGWVFMECILVGSGLAIILFNHFLIKEKTRTPSLIIFFLTLALGSFASVGLAFGPKEFFTLFKEGIEALKDFLNPSLSLWPDLYIAVGELRSADLPLLVELTGGVIAFIITLIGFIGQIVRLARRPGQYPLTFITVLVFSVIAVGLSFGAQRFILLSLTPLSLLFASGLNDLTRGLSGLIARLPFKTNWVKNLQLSFQVIVSSVLIVVLTIGAYRSIPGLLNQIYNDTWDATFKKIEQETPADSIVNTWWPPGHFIKAMAKRRVTVDGATINKPQAYWLANVFLSSTEREALGYLRMLNNCGNDAVDYLTEKGIPLSSAVDLLKEIMPLSRQAATERLAGKLSPRLASDLLAMTHKIPPPTYVMFPSELMDGAIQYGFVGRWNFRRVEELRSRSSSLTNLPRKGSKDYVPFLWQLSGGYPKISDPMNPLVQKDNKIIFDNDIRVDLASRDCLINSPTYGQGKPTSMVFPQNDQVVEKFFPDANLRYSLLLVPQDNSFQCLLMEDFFARSLLMRLYYFPETRHKYFTLFSKKSDMTNRTNIIVYKVDWGKFLQDIGE